jgi:isopentenyl diphosphate isomerase/L-lactate dehydrogenase-like FMN-dependent dehydrogenase
LHRREQPDPRETFALDEFLNVGELEDAARRKLPVAVYEYVVGGAGDETTAAANVSAWSRYRLRPRVMIDVSTIDTRARVLGDHAALPVGLAPCGWQRFLHPEAELATARAAGVAGVPLCVSTGSTCPLEEVADAYHEAGGSVAWFQLYVNQNRDLVQHLLRRAAGAGYRAVVVTADLPVSGYRERELRHQLELGEGVEPANFRAFGANRSPLELMEGFTDPSLTWSDLAWIREASGLPVVVKGLLTGEDADLAVEHGASGVVVSNHGGRQLDRTPATVDVLEEVVNGVRGRAEVYLDGGVRRGTDVLIALGLGARAVFVGRPYLWGLAAGGERGVARVLEILNAEISNAMALTGVTRVDQIDRAHVRSPHAN